MGERACVVAGNIAFGGCHKDMTTIYVVEPPYASDACDQGDVYTCGPMAPDKPAAPTSLYAISPNLICVPRAIMAGVPSSSLGLGARGRKAARW